jgi:hypothetical protein
MESTNNIKRIRSSKKKRLRDQAKSKLRASQCNGDLVMSSVAMSTTDNAVANSYVEYEVDMYFSTNGSTFDAGQTKYPVRQLNMDLTRLPGVQRNDVSENKRPVIISGALFAKPLFSLTGDAYAGNPNIYYGRLVTPLGSNMGTGLADDIALYDNGVMNLEPNVNQNYVKVGHMHYLSAMPNNAPSSRNVDDEDITNLLVVALARPDGVEWSGASVDFRFVLKYKVPVVLTSTVDFFVNRFNEGGVPGFVDGILSLAQNLKDEIAGPIGDTNNPAETQQLVFPDAVRVLKQ